MVLSTRFGLATGSRAVMFSDIATHRLNLDCNRAVHYTSGPEGAARATREGRGAERDAITVQTEFGEATQDWWAFDSVRIEFSGLDILVDFLGTPVRAYFLEPWGGGWNQIIDTSRKGCSLETQFETPYMHGGHNDGC